MKRYVLLRLQYGANGVLAEHKSASFASAVNYFKEVYADLNLDCMGYAKVEATGVSYCIAECYESISSLPVR